jgi:hypothetical protein
MGEAEELVRALGELLANMSPRTRRPIRFLETEDTQPAADSALLGGDSVPPSGEKGQETKTASASVVPINRISSSP